MRLAAIFLLFSTFILAQSKDEIRWDDEKPLEWADFKGKVPSSDPYYASTNSGIHFSYSLTETMEGAVLISWEIYSSFNPRKSWVKKGRETEGLLDHERLHFAISEYCARVMHETLLNFDFISIDNEEEKLMEIYESVQDLQVALQNQYDEETDHSENEEMQLKWEQKIYKDLNALPPIEF